MVAAAALASDAHHGQLRDHGTAYIEHPLSVARILAEEIGITEPDVLIAALLHDVVEDSPLRVEDIDEQFGTWVANAVETLTKPEAPPSEKPERDRRYYERLQHAPETVQLIKLADRLDNLRHLPLSPRADKKARYIRETRTHFLPMAERLGKLVEQFERALKVAEQSA